MAPAMLPDTAFGLREQCYQGLIRLFGDYRYSWDDTVGAGDLKQPAELRSIGGRIIVAPPESCRRTRRAPCVELVLEPFVDWRPGFLDIEQMLPSVLSVCFERLLGVVQVRKMLRQVF